MLINSIVKIYVPLCSGNNGVGVGFFVSPNHILTCRHVVDREDRYPGKWIRASYGWAKYRRVEIITLGYEHDLALLKVEGKGGAPLEFKDGVKRGDKIKLKTFDKLWRGTRRGFVIEKSHSGFAADIRSVKGQSGSPAVIGRFSNMRVVGILRSKGLKTGCGYFIGVQTIKAFLAGYIQ